VKRVEHGSGVLEPADQRGVVAPERVQSGDLHPGGELLVLGVDPVGQDPAGAALDDVEQPRRTPAGWSQVNQPGGEPGRAGRRRLQERCLIDTEHPHQSASGRGVQDLGAVLDDRPHHRRPADPQVGGDRGDVGGVLPDPPAGLHPGPFGQHRPGPDRLARLGPRPRLA